MWDEAAEEEPIMFARYVLLVLLWVGAPAWAKTPTVVVLGDSLSAGYGMNADQSWVTLLQARLRREGYPQEVVNASVSGATTEDGRTRLPRLLKRYHPQVVVIELGGNDGLRGLSLEAMHANLAAIIERTREAGAEPLLVGMRLPPNYGAAYTGRFERVYQELAREYSAPLVPFLLQHVAGNAQLMQPDGMHARAAAQPKILDNVWPHLKALLPGTRRTSAALSLPAQPGSHPSRTAQPAQPAPAPRAG
jgi:acyl-CoA thioesterase-1